MKESKKVEVYSSTGSFFYSDVRTELLVSGVLVITQPKYKRTVYYSPGYWTTIEIEE